MVLGGFIIESDFGGLGWRMIFLVNVPIGIFSILMARFIPKSYAPDRPLLDWSGVIIVSIRLVLFLAHLIESPNHGWTIWSSLSFISSVFVLFWFWKLQTRKRFANLQPLIDTGLFHQPRFMIG
ncbi:hypothetical protein [Oceanobacillus sojae]|uniref:hypothetical protein n=1 Tax=Oceanobacillus sojae TaxID=582851 RepID=UPI00363E414C